MKQDRCTMCTYPVSPFWTARASMQQVEPSGPKALAGAERPLLLASARSAPSPQERAVAPPPFKSGRLHPPPLKSRRLHRSRSIAPAMRNLPARARAPGWGLQVRKGSLAQMTYLERRGIIPTRRRARRSGPFEANERYLSNCTRPRNVRYIST